MTENKYLVSKWFENNTFHSHDFANIDSLLALKQKQNVTISLGLPALNEEATVENVITVLKNELLLKYPLLDELVLIDSSSTDRTVEIAKSYDIPVYQHKELLTSAGTNRGKGEALWKSLSALKGDIIVWVDTDIRNIHPRFVYGLVGPLLRRPEIMYVKGFYIRPIQLGGELKPVGGGRVTEILARPFLNTFYPELSGFVQPLSGEYAGRREALEQIPFSVGYGVETGMLIDLLRKYGINALAQVDLETRIHRNQKIQDLGRMSFGIMQAMFNKLSDDNKVKVLAEMNETLNIVASKGNLTTLQELEIREIERPPIITIPEYKETRNIPAADIVSVSVPQQADIVIGIPTFNNAKTIGHVLDAVKIGVSKYFADKKIMIITSDGGSTDGTNEIVAESFREGFHNIQVAHPLYPIHSMIVPYHGIRGKGSAIKTIFEKAAEANAKAVAIMDADLKSVNPEWIDLILRPILVNKYDFVAPYYMRHKYDGTITNTIIYPLFVSLFGQNLRQPIGGDFGFSGHAVNTYLQRKDVWESDIARFGIDIWLSTLALAENLKICQTFLGAKIHNTKDPAIDLSEMLSQVVGTTFSLLNQYKSAWLDKDISTISEIPLYGFVYEAAAEPVNVNLERMHANFVQGVSDLKPILKNILPNDVFEELVNLSSAKLQDFKISNTLWAKIIYNFLIAYNARQENPEFILKSLTPLYLGKVASFVQETWLSSTRQSEDKVSLLAQAFLAEKPYLIQNWQNAKIKT